MFRRHHILGAGHPVKCLHIGIRLVERFRQGEAMLDMGVLRWKPQTLERYSWTLTKSEKVIIQRSKFNSQFVAGKRVALVNAKHHTEK